MYAGSVTPVHLHRFIFLKGWLLEKKGLNFRKIHRFIFLKGWLLEKKGLKFRKAHRFIFFEKGGKSIF
jgi:hypothetical protein